MKNPILNALSATAYITAIVFGIYYVSGMNIPEDGIFIPIFMLSLLVISVSMMGYFFLYEPLNLLIEGKQKEAGRFFFTTIVLFACITAVIVAVWFFFVSAL